MIYVFNELVYYEKELFWSGVAVQTNLTNMKGRCGGEGVE